ncbi:MAG: ferredoxin, partial [Acidobacteriia bacterium]|nr:ferredoxin [Terriglobia bacterium]
MDPLEDKSKQLASVAAALHIGDAGRHIFLCADQTNPKCAPREESIVAWDYLKKRLAELGLLQASPCVFR